MKLWAFGLNLPFGNSRSLGGLEGKPNANKEMRKWKALKNP